ncbi:PREDICTED: calcium-binding tyrosine phosphorylation-regulated protein isoform X2 [Chinchilla lanigera]|uniref:Calcium-binding tyrosine phosphorylation-regulated protein n=1 Tax=Chinchilla lanigera TaxID=34839 RepID=A0A8C2W247_CHILA|nr:PREDICTED: calcium-binding tyrosine phosphorylation-regulated protein isoform X2 [Chinchilla lanigera]
MISSKSRLVVPYGLKTLLEGVSRAILKTNPSNITEFAAVYFKELILFREGNMSLDIKDLVKQFHQIKVEKWSEGMMLEKKLERLKESEGTPVVFQEPTRMEKCTDTEEDSISGPQFTNKTTQFPLVSAECLQPETGEAVHRPSSKPATPKATTPPPSPSPAPATAEFAYIPADPAQFATQMLAIATSEAGQPPPYSNNMWTLYCLTDMNQQSRPSPPPAPGPLPQATLYLSNSKDPQFLQQNSPKVTSAYVMMDDSKKTSPPPFILVGANVPEAQDWKPLPGHTVVSQADGLKRYATVQVPIAVAADQKSQKHTQSPQNASPPTSGHDGPRPQSPVFLSVAFPVEDVAKKGSGSGDKHTPFGSYGIAGEITVTSAHVRKTES